MDKFIKVDYYPRHLVKEGRVRDTDLKTISTFIRLDTFLQIDDLEPLRIYFNYLNDPKDDEVVQMSHCYLSRQMGLGINGMTSDIYLTKDSYNKVVKALGLIPEEIKTISINIGG